MCCGDEERRGNGGLAVDDHMLRMQICGTWCQAKRALKLYCLNCVNLDIVLVPLDFYFG